jgi:hypothetical protein
MQTTATWASLDSVNALATYRTLAAPPVLGATTAFRMGAGYLGTWSSRAPRLVTLGLHAWEPGPDAEQAAETFWEEWISAARDSTNAALDELERGVEDIGALTHAEQKAPSTPPASDASAA